MDRSKRNNARGQNSRKLQADRPLAAALSGTGASTRANTLAKILAKILARTLAMAFGATMLLAGGAAAANAQQGIATDLETIRHGKALAERNCASCHQIGLDGDSPNPLAPAFWAMFTRRPAETIAGMLINKTGPAHSGMPVFEVTQEQAWHLASWIAWVQPAAHGRRLIEENCGACHAVGLNDESSHPDAPAFRELSREYPIDALEEAFAGTIETGHPDMPVFKVNDLQLQDMLAYIGQLQTEYAEGGLAPAD